jgi:uncharacterized protein (TIGR01370 family)
MGRVRCTASAAFALGLLALAAACAPAVNAVRADLDRRVAGTAAWWIDYDCQHPPPEDVALLVTDPASRCNPRASEHASGAVWLAYLSVGEVNQGHPSYAWLVATGIVLGANPHWPDARSIDTRSPLYRSVYLDPTLAAITAQGYQGVFLDTLDEALARAPDTVVSIVRDIRAQHADWVIVPNGGLDALERLRPYVDGWAAEDVFEGFDFATRGYRVTDPYRQKTVLARLRRARDLGLGVFVVDYAWDDPTLRASLRQRELAEGFHSLVTTIDHR